jgi:hypothetical protein
MRNIDSYILREAAVAVASLSKTDSVASIVLGKLMSTNSSQLEQRTRKMVDASIFMYERIAIESIILSLFPR